MEQHEIFDFDSNGGFATTEFLNGLDGPQSTLPRLSSNSSTQFAAICAAPLNTSTSGITSSLSSVNLNFYYHSRYVSIVMFYSKVKKWNPLR
ncbi:unnamed protein product [Meloidogyne enterolobii]|uniref:Uncharacterized protein n=1 Tax=Meloidogyne enterolobii TaxID=390850 RepID=A0ACB0XKN8_MELEN